ncbi:hypothetical protein Pst134EA_019058 [Puccinia striiformis f. sp. tritici]|uniref:C2H2-type domain-containing protein n=1 Tax=Puccinia striiformis f. sp. tritici PST-78 TaxID=1165861 RepID=A0A0L0VTB7_9BASI|nr:uncharacterized protein Pst134EA_032262 [Puccinia striiformis f. sp. tritici]XP_047802976.1 hypothetical protein Pst134EA_019058 [Puccinia striiformis f. sp. tritici]KNF02501.1 hypothetical protein PSTG_04406 [Puccinia striiformis f. sp. tritici PST-78]KAH9440671.1 hypothetical protein Pst134EA_032262 [Puccinia striiformis f. sp. tritici]KAH9449145.1 hypothetical protein Pst134EB_019979 [Puccinia striiformis f. sp. tritici]KAH9458904.1 hypothetical protein Pst134EA_019058 [Puccinia striifor
MKTMTNRPNLPPLRLALAHFDDPAAIESIRDHPNCHIPHRARCSTWLHKDLSFYSLASSSTHRYDSSPSCLLSPKGYQRSAQTDHLRKTSSMQSCITHSDNVSQTSDNRQNCYNDPPTNHGDRGLVQLGRSPTPESSSRERPKAQPSSPPTRSEISWICQRNQQQKSSLEYPSVRYTDSGGALFNQTQPQVEVAKTSQLVLSQPYPRCSNQSASFKEPQYSGGRKTQDASETPPRAKVQPTETASGIRYLCPVWECGKSFTRNFNLTQHYSAIHKDERRFSCTYCLATFYRRNDLTRHERAHTGVRPYRCECGQDFTRTDLLARHKHSGNCTYQIIR